MSVPAKEQAPAPADAGSVLELKRTIIAIRRQMEEIKFEKQETVNKEVADLRAEIGQLKATIVAQREELERQSASQSGKIQAIERRARDEQKQLQDMIVALREQLEARNG